MQHYNFFFPSLLFSCRFSGNKRKLGFCDFMQNFCVALQVGLEAYLCAGDVNEENGKIFGHRTNINSWLTLVKRRRWHWFV